MGLVLLVARPIGAAVITVTGAGSAVAIDGSCSLGEAILAANTDTAQSSNAPGECLAGSGADTIVLTGDVSLTLEHSGQTGTPSVSSAVTVRGYGHTIERSSAAGTPEFRIFHVSSAGDLTLKDTTVRNGGGATFSADGGGIYSEGSVRITGSRLVDNSVSTSLQLGGGIYSGIFSTLHLVRTVVESCTARRGGGISSWGTAEIVESTIASNFAGYSAGGLENNGQMSVSNSSVSNNWTDGSGGGISSWWMLSVANSTVSGNRAYGGGGINLNTGSAELNNITLVDNSAAGLNAGAAFYVSDAGSNVNLTGSLIADNSGLACAGPAPIFHNGPPNLTDDASCDSLAYIPGLSGFASILADNGGPSPTHALLAGSDAIDAAGDCGLLTDQRGALRVGACDVGAYELGDATGNLADDQYETSGSGGTDDTCFGHPALFGLPEDHLHTADRYDWSWFRPLEGSAYEIETTNLIGGSDTVLELYRGCTLQLAENDDIDGTTLASRITYTATAADTPGLDVLARDLHGAGVDRGYEVTIRCTGGPCADCPVGGGADFVLAGETIFTHREIEACDSITVQDAVVESGGTAILRSGGHVVLGSDFAVRPGGALVIENDPDLE